MGWLMLNNDLSDKMAPLIVFNFENVICEKVERKILGYQFKLDFQTVSAVNKLFFKDFRIVYATLVWPDKKVTKLEEELDDLGCAYNGVVKFGNVDSLALWLKRNQVLGYYDTDKETLAQTYPFGKEWEQRLQQVWSK